MSKVTGSGDYWRGVANDLRAMDNELGGAHLFMTLSPAEYHWDDMREALRMNNRDFKKFRNWRDLLNYDPVTVLSQFNRRWKAILDALTDEQNPLLGHVVTEYFWRMEFQSRGAPHIHMKLWIKGTVCCSLLFRLF